MMAELDVAIDEREQGMVATYTNIVSRFDFGAALADNNAAGGYQLAIEAFHAEHLRVAIATIARATHAFFMCHVLFLFLGFCIVSFSHAAAARCLFLRLSFGFCITAF